MKINFNNANLIALDPSLRATGYAVMEEGNLVHCGCIETFKQPGLISESDTLRLNQIANVLRFILAGNSQVLAEEPVGSKSSTAMKALASVKGLLIGFASGYSKNLTFIKAKTVKKKLTGNPNASKEELLKIVNDTFPNFATLTKGFNKNKLFAASDACAILISHFLQ